MKKRGGGWEPDEKDRHCSTRLGWGNECWRLAQAFHWDAADAEALSGIRIEY